MQTKTSGGSGMAPHMEILSSHSPLNNHLVWQSQTEQSGRKNKDFRAIQLDLGTQNSRRPCCENTQYPQNAERGKHKSKTEPFLLGFCCWEGNQIAPLACLLNWLYEEPRGKGITAEHCYATCNPSSQQWRAAKPRLSAPVMISLRHAATHNFSVF